MKSTQLMRRAGGDMLSKHLPYCTYTESTEIMLILDIIYSLVVGDYYTLNYEYIYN